MFALVTRPLNNTNWNYVRIYQLANYTYHESITNHDVNCGIFVIVTVLCRQVCGDLPWVLESTPRNWSYSIVTTKRYMYSDVPFHDMAFSVGFIVLDEAVIEASRISACLISKTDWVWLTLQEDGWQRVAVWPVINHHLTGVSRAALHRHKATLNCPDNRRDPGYHHNDSSMVQVSAAVLHVDDNNIL